MMTEEQFEQTLRELLQRRPYKPVRVVLQEGEQFEIDDPQYVVRRGGYAAWQDPTGFPHSFDYQTVAQFIVDPAEITS
jgi:hypothetical protein